MVELHKIIQMRYFLFLLLISFSTVSYGQTADTTYAEKYQMEYEKRITMTHINGRYIPADVDDAMKTLDRIVDHDGKERFKVEPEDHAVKTIHFSFGRWMIVNWGFYEGSRLSHYLKTKGITFPDDMATTLMYCYHRKLNDEPLQLDSLANHFSDLRREEAEKKMEERKVIEKESIIKN